MQASDALAAEGVAAAVVSAPCLDLFANETADYRRAVLGAAQRIGIEAAIQQGWDRWLGDDGLFIGMEGFGASAPAEDLYRHFGITTDAVVSAAKSKLT